MKELRVRLYPDQDEKLLSWLEELDKLPFGVKSQTIKETLTRGLNMNSCSTAINQGSNIAVDTGELLSDIRRVVEASLEGCLSRLAITPLTALPITPVPDEIDALLDDFGANLMMLDEEEDDA